MTPNETLARSAMYRVAQDWLSDHIASPYAEQFQDDLTALLGRVAIDTLWRVENEICQCGSKGLEKEWSVRHHNSWCPAFPIEVQIAAFRSSPLGDSPVGDGGEEKG